MLITGTCHASDPDAGVKREEGLGLLGLLGLGGL